MAEMEYGKMKKTLIVVAALVAGAAPAHACDIVGTDWAVYLFGTVGDRAFVRECKLRTTRDDLDGSCARPLQDPLTLEGSLKLRNCQDLDGRLEVSNDRGVLANCFVHATLNAAGDTIVGLAKCNSGDAFALNAAALLPPRGSNDRNGGGSQVGPPNLGGSESECSGPNC
jgi:hypothetical protein